ncbi:MAG: carboxypeptidase regulatory-like domain-containing protein [Myxococcales bacterium]|nr:carboxypeptidase regulatory-like domain-containing protein [Myxococcales bacterium]
MKRGWWGGGVVVVIALVLTWYLLHRRGGGEDAGSAPSAGSGSSSGHIGALTPIAAPAANEVPRWFAQANVPAKRIAGIVTFQGARVAGVEVRLTSRLTRAGRSQEVVRTDATGAFDLGAHPAAVYTVSSTAADRVGAQLEIDLRDPTAKPAPDALELKLLACTASISGHVYDSSGGPIEKAKIALGGSRAVTDASGAYRVCARREEAQLLVEADGYAGVRLSVEPAGELVRDVILVPEAVVVGRVIRAADSAPVPAATVYVIPVSPGQEGPAAVTVTTDAAGQFRAVGVMPGPIIAMATADGLGTESAVRITVLVGQTTPEITIRVFPTLRVSGTVRGAGKPIAGAKVEAATRSPSRRSGDAITQADGSFTLEQVWPGDNMFLVTPYEVVSPTTIPLKADRDGVVIEVAMLAKIRGRTLRGGQPAPNTHIQVNGPELNANIVSDEAGAYEIGGLRAGAYKLLGFHDGLGAFGGPLAVVVAAAETKDGADIELEFGATISGTIVDQNGKPASGVFIRYAQPNGDLGEATTALDGSFRCGALTGKAAYSPAVFPVRGQSRAFHWAGAAPAAIPLADGTSHVENVRLAILRDHLSIRGTVVDSAGAPVPDVRVRAQPLDQLGTPEFSSWLPLASAVTDVDGAFAIADLPGGAYALQARGVDGAEAIVPSVEAGTSGVKMVVLRTAGIDGTLVGFSDVPLVYAQSRSDTSRFIGAQVDGTTFQLRNLAPGSYMLTAQSPNEGDATRLELAPGATVKVTMTSHGRGTIAAQLVAFGGVGGIPTTAVCHVVVRAGDVAGITNWDPATAPRANAQGIVTFDPAPAGDVFVQCFDQSGRWSDGQVATTVPAAGRVTVQIPLVRSTLAEVAGNPGEVGIEFGSQAVGGLIAAVVKDSAAARAGIVPGDAIVTIDGASVAALTPGGIAYLIGNHPIGTTVKVGILHGAATRTETLAVASPH